MADTARSIGELLAADLHSLAHVERLAVYRHRAEEARRAEAAAHDPEAKLAFRFVALGWEHLVARLERT